MATLEEALARIRANTDIANSAVAALDLLKEGQTNIVDAVADLKAQIAAGVPPDLTDVEAALDQQDTAMSSLKADVTANTV